MRLISWNVNGLRACLQKGFMKFFNETDCDVFCIQETKLQPDQLDLCIPGYRIFLNSADKKGYSGTSVITRCDDVNVTYGMGIDEHDHEGRIIITELPDFRLLNVYVPNTQRELARLSYRMEWEEKFLELCKRLDSDKPLIICGDMNVAHEEIDLKNPKTNHLNAGFTDQEREKMTTLLAAGFTDTFRHFYPTLENQYSWWSYRMGARAKNIGWRIDYFLVSNRLVDRLESATIHSNIMGSDHCPVEAVIRG